MFFTRREDAERTFEILRDCDIVSTQSIHGAEYAEIRRSSYWKQLSLNSEEDREIALKFFNNSYPDAKTQFPEVVEEFQTPSLSHGLSDDMEE